MSHAPGSRVRVTHVEPGYDAVPGIFTVESYVEIPEVVVMGEKWEPFYFLLRDGGSDGMAHTAPAHAVVAALEVVT